MQSYNITIIFLNATIDSDAEMKAMKPTKSRLSFTTDRQEWTWGYTSSI